jgi:drug/metabolite transporter (DMT)-like permease
MQKAYLYPTLQTLVAAALFGASAPLGKLLLGQIDPILLAGLLYLGCGTGVLLFRLFQRMGSPNIRREAHLMRSDYRWLFSAVITGGILAPILLLFSLRETPASTASLLLNFETAATSAIAVVVFREALSGRILWVVLAVTVGSILLSWDASGEWGFSLGALGVLGACVLWGLENNLTRNISAKDPLTIVLIKGISAGTFSCVLALILGNPLPPALPILGAMVLGSLSYGLSIVLYIRAMRNLGAARTSAIFGTAPLAGVILSFVLFRETLTGLFIAAMLLMIFAMALLITEKHAHKHLHEAVVHDHRHRHDDGHHTHDHPGMVDRSFTHSHMHEHAAVEHEHPHLPDIHHRHAHAD